jgi:hypothetical protein
LNGLKIERKCYCQPFFDTLVLPAGIVIWNVIITPACRVFTIHKRIARKHRGLTLKDLIHDALYELGIRILLGVIAMTHGFLALLRSPWLDNCSTKEATTELPSFLNFGVLRSSHHRTPYMSSTSIKLIHVVSSVSTFYILKQY